MPRSSNARFDENGFAEAVRDIEQLYMMLQDGTNDLNAEASNVDADEPEGGGGGGGDTATPVALRGLQYSNPGPITLSGSTLLNAMSAQVYDTLGGFTVATGTFAAPYDGMYAIELLGVISWATAVAARIGLSASPANSGAIYSDIPTLATAGYSSCAISGIRPMVVGELVTIYAAISGGFGGGTFDAIGTFTVTYLGAES